MNRVSRRSALLYVAGAGSVLSGSSLRGQAPQRASAFALIGDRYHNSDYIRVALGKTIQADMGLDIDFRDDVTLLSAEQLAGRKLLIMLRDGMIWPGGYPQLPPGSQPIESSPPIHVPETKPVYWIRPEQGKAVKDFVLAGGSVLFYHNVTYISPHNDDFRDVLGAVTREHPPLRPFKVKVVNKDHPITRDISDFVITDEQHFVAYQKDPKYLLLESVNENGLGFKDLGNSSPAGWAYDYGRGRVCYLAPGHLITALWNPEYQKLQQNAVRWLLRQI